MKQYLSLSIFSFFLFVILSFLVAKGEFIQTDFDLTVKIQDRIPDFLTTPLSTFSILGTVETASMILLICMLIFPSLRRISILIFYALTGFIEVLGKIIIEQKGPPISFLKTDLSVAFPSSYIPHEFFSYPSGHAARTAFISAVLLFALWKSPIRKELKIIFAICVLSFDLLMFVSRVYLGEHWSSDVLGGALLGFSLSILAFSFGSLKSGKS
ncbi:MAG: phosphatase PAP2 family protein [Candidatus Levybacteria bacterium]|nr:phosphatase PAP2 family protein [Candidatus Levybacteria bacterium]